MTSTLLIVIQVYVQLDKLNTMKCPSCGNELIWGGDHSYEDYGMEGEGIVSNSTCPNHECNVDTVLVYTKTE